MSNICQTMWHVSNVGLKCTYFTHMSICYIQQKYVATSFLHACSDMSEYFTFFCCVCVFHMCHNMLHMLTYIEYAWVSEICHNICQNCLAYVVSEVLTSAGHLAITAKLCPSRQSKGSGKGDFSPDSPNFLPVWILSDRQRPLFFII